MGAILRMPKKLWMVRNSSAQPLPDAGNYHFPTGGGQFAGFSRSFLFQHSSEQKSQGSKQAHQPCQVVLKGIPWISSPHSEQKKRKRSSGISSDRVKSPGDESRSAIAGSFFTGAFSRNVPCAQEPLRVWYRLYSMNSAHDLHQQRQTRCRVRRQPFPRRATSR